jgi:thioredoxin-like negative regulator of GroEL
MENYNFEEGRNNFLREAENLLRQNNLPGVLSLAGQRLQNYPADADALGIYCEALIGMGRLEKMRQLLDGVMEIISGLNIICERAGDACREKGFYHEASVCYEKFMSLRPETERSREIIGKMAFSEDEDSPQAVIDFSCTENASEQKIFTVTMAQLYIEQGHLQDAQIILDEIIKKEPHNAQALAILEELRDSRARQLVGKAQSLKKDNLVKMLSSWLKNIERLKNNAAEK